MPILDERHDFAHPVEGDEAWSESYYFNAYDPATDTGFYTRIGVRPNEGTMDISLTLWLPGNEVAMVRAVRECKEMTDTDLSVGGVTYERVVPMKEWRLTAEADAWVMPIGGGRESIRQEHLTMDVTFTALIPAIGGDGQNKEGSGASAETRLSVGKGHLEQAGEWAGTLAVGDRSWTFGPECRGNRDKSWGPRRWGGPQMWRWFSVNLGGGSGGPGGGADQAHFGGIRIGTPEGDLHRGWVWRDGANSSIREWKVTSELADDDLTHTVTHVEATDAEGRVHQLRADVLRVHGIPADAKNTTVVGEGLARWTYEGCRTADGTELPTGQTGFGISEYLHQLDEDGRPKTPIE